MASVFSPRVWSKELIEQLSRGSLIYTHILGMKFTYILNQPERVARLCEFLTVYCDVVKPYAAGSTTTIYVDTGGTTVGIRFSDKTMYIADGLLEKSDGS